MYTRSYQPRSSVSTLFEDKKIRAKHKFIYSFLLQGKDQSRRDDLLALGYMFFHFLSGGQLPWAGIKDGERKRRYQKVFIIKDKAELTLIGPGHPREFDQYMR